MTLKNLIRSKKGEFFRPEIGPTNVYYIGLPKRFVAGTVIFKDTDECAENVKITLRSTGIKLTCNTNNYGDFEFEGIVPNRQLTVLVEHPGYHPQEYKIQTLNDVFLGEIFLDADGINS